MRHTWFCDVEREGSLHGWQEGDAQQLRGLHGRPFVDVILVAEESRVSRAEKESEVKRMEAVERATRGTKDGGCGW